MSENYEKKKKSTRKVLTFSRGHASSDDKKKNKIQRSGPKETCKSLKTIHLQHLIMFCNDVYMKLVRLYGDFIMAQLADPTLILPSLPFNIFASQALSQDVILVVSS